MTPRFNFIGMAVADMGRSLAFYRKLGLDIPAGGDSEPHVEVALPGGFRLAWDTVDTIRSFDPDYQQPGVSQIGLGFECDTPSDVNALYIELIDAGHQGVRKPWDAFWGQRYATVQDPDGNDVDLYAALPTDDS